MRMRTTITWLLMCSLLVAAPARAQQVHIASAAAMRQAVTDKIDRDEANRRAITTVLHRPDVRAMAERMGLGVERADAAVRSLDSADLERLAGPARAAEANLAGGSNTIVISTTTLLLLLILVVLLVK